MKYKLINQFYDKTKSIIETVLLNRGIADPYTYVHLTDGYIQDYHDLENIEKAVERLTQAIENNEKIKIVVDSDCDGHASAAILYSYLYKIYNSENISYYIQEGKSHGIPKNLSIFDDTGLIFCPDSSTNDVEQCEQLEKRGKTVIILDHHQSEKPNNYAIIVNNQISPKYKNKQLCGTGIVWQYLRALDDFYWNNYADNYLDLVALANIADSMDLREYETKRLVDKGLESIHNKLFVALLDKQLYSTNGIVNITNVQFYINPLINGLVRSGTPEDKELMFRAFCELDEWFDYKKRGEEQLIKEDIYSRVARLSVNARSRQNREIDKGIEKIEKDIAKYGWDKNKILFAEANNIDGSYTGLTCMKLASKYSKPCVLLRDTWKADVYGGSLRNFDGSPIDDLKDFLLKTNKFEYVQGHPNAAGISLKKENIREVIKLTNEMLADVDFDKVWKVDFIFTPDEITYDVIQEFNELKDITECYVAVERIKINTNQFEILGSNKDTWKAMLNDEISMVKFKCVDDKILELINEDWGGSDIELNVVGKISFSVYNGIIEPQIIVSDFELKEGN